MINTLSRMQSNDARQAQSILAMLSGGRSLFTTQPAPPKAKPAPNKKKPSANKAKPGSSKAKPSPNKPKAQSGFAMPNLANQAALMQTQMAEMQMQQMMFSLAYANSAQQMQLLGNTLIAMDQMHQGWSFFTGPSVYSGF